MSRDLSSARSLLERVMLCSVLNYNAEGERCSISMPWDLRNEIRDALALSENSFVKCPHCGKEAHDPQAA